MSYIVCTRCNKPLKIARGSRMRTHATCGASDELMAEVLALREQFPAATDGRIARDLGIAVRVLHLWLDAARHRRAKQRRADLRILKRNHWTL